VRGEFGGLVWASPAMNAVVDRARRLAPSRLPLVLTGPSGVGKTAFARAIHEASGRSGAFEVVDVPSVAGPRFAAEVFGAAAGAWTDGRRERIGAVVRADRGTLFLDEIAECPLADQARLLKVLEEQRVRPLGSERGLQVDVRIVVATREDLAARVRAGAFRSDLWHRLRGDVLALPSLQRRPGDVRLVAQRWLASHAPGRTLSPAAWDVLAARAWRARSASCCTCSSARWRWLRGRSSRWPTSRIRRTRPSIGRWTWARRSGRWPGRAARPRGRWRCASRLR
jgi:DNA-binding NtrC family response regulator